MNVRFPSFAGPSPAAAPAAASRPGAAPSGPGAAGDAKGFAGTLTDALKNVSNLQQESASLQQQFQVGAPGASLEQTMVSMQKSQVAFQAALTVRNRFVAAYTDIMNMQV